MMPGAGVPVAGTEFGAAASAPLLRLARELAGDDHALEAARTLTAWATGFISMELNGGFRLGGDVEDAWKFGVKRIVESIMVISDRSPQSRPRESAELAPSRTSKGPILHSRGGEGRARGRHGDFGEGAQGRFDLAEVGR